MRALLILTLFFGLSAHGMESFPFKPVPGFGFKVDVKTTKPGKSLKIKRLYRDQEGDSYALIYTKGAFPVIGGKTSSNMPEILPQDNLYTIVRISNEGEAIWAFHLNNKGNSQFAIDNFRVSPQGNIAIILGFEGDLEVQGSLRKFKSLKRDLLYLFMKKEKGALVKTLHFTGREDEKAGDLTWGTGGENLIHFKSVSDKVSFDHGYYIFNNKEEPREFKDVIFRLKKNFFPKWTRSIEPSALKSVTFHDQDHVLLNFTHSREYQGFWRKGKSIKIYQKPRRSKKRGIAISLNTDGKKVWEVQLRHHKGGGYFTASKAFPDGGIGLIGNMLDKELSLYGQASYTSSGKNPVQLFFKINNKGLLEQEAQMEGKNVMPSVYETNSNGTIFFMSSGKEKSLSYNNLRQSTTKITPNKTPTCRSLFIVDEDHNPAYEVSKSSCAKISSRDHLRLASGFIEVLRKTKKNEIELLKVKYSEEKLDDETIEGLAYQPNFINEKTTKSQPIEYNMSYAIPPKVLGAMVYFISHPRKHLDALRDPLMQASLNAAYFRNYVPITIWSSQKKIEGAKVDQLFEDILKKKVLKKEYPWFMQAFGVRATQVNSLYKDKSLNSTGLLDPKMLILWDFQDLPLETENKKELMSLQVSRSRPTLLISPWQNKEVVSQRQDLFYEFDRQRKKSAHIITEPQPIRKMSFAAIPKVGIAISQSLKEELKKEECLTAKGTFKKDPDKPEYKSRCINSLEPYKKLAPATQERVFKFMKELWSPSDYIPYYDKEIYNFIEGGDKAPIKRSAPGP